MEIQTTGTTGKATEVVILLYKNIDEIYIEAVCLQSRGSLREALRLLKMCTSIDIDYKDAYPRLMEIERTLWLD